MEVEDLIVEGAAGARLDGRQGVPDHALRKVIADARRVALDRTMARHVVRHAGRRQQRREVEATLARGIARARGEPLGPPDQFAEAAHAERGHDLAALLRDEAEVVLDHGRQAKEELGAQQFVLGGDAGCTVVQVTDAQVLAAERHHGPRAETERFGAENCRLDDVEAGLESAIGLQPDPVAHLVDA